MSICVENVSYIYGKGTPFERAAIEDIDLTIDKGEFIGIIGHTGSGKSTLIQHLNGLLRRRRRSGGKDKRSYGEAPFGGHGFPISRASAL